MHPDEPRTGARRPKNVERLPQHLRRAAVHLAAAHEAVIVEPAVEPEGRHQVWVRVEPDGSIPAGPEFVGERRQFDRQRVGHVERPPHLAAPLEDARRSLADGVGLVRAGEQARHQRSHRGLRERRLGDRIGDEHGFARERVEIRRRGTARAVAAERVGAQGVDGDQRGCQAGSPDASGTDAVDASARPATAASAASRRDSCRMVHVEDGGRRTTRQSSDWTAALDHSHLGTSLRKRP